MLLIIELGDEVQNVRLNMYYVEEHLNLAARGGDVLIIKDLNMPRAEEWQKGCWRVLWFACTGPVFGNGHSPPTQGFAFAYIFPFYIFNQTLSFWYFKGFYIIDKLEIDIDF